MDEKTNAHVGKKVLYTIVILMSCLLILLSAAGVIGVWLVERPLSDTAVALLQIVEDTTVTARAATGRVDQGLVKLQEATNTVSQASDQLSQNVTDKGMVMVLLPEEQEQNITETAGSIKETFSNIRVTITKALDLYRSINRLPFINLPGLEEDQVETIAASLEQTQASAETLRQEIADFRSGVSTRVDRITAAAEQLDNGAAQARERLSQLDARLADLGALAIRLQEVIPGVLMALTVILTVIFAFVIFTQVEVIRLYVQRWRLLAKPQEIAPPDSLAQTAQ